MTQRGYTVTTRRREVHYQPTQFPAPEPVPNPSLPSHVQWMQLHPEADDGGVDFGERWRDYADDGWLAC